MLWLFRVIPQSAKFRVLLLIVFFKLVTSDEWVAVPNGDQLVIVHKPTSDFEVRNTGSWGSFLDTFVILVVAVGAFMVLLCGIHFCRFYCRSRGDGRRPSRLDLVEERSAGLPRPSGDRPAFRTQISYLAAPPEYGTIVGKPTVNSFSRVGSMMETPPPSYLTVAPFTVNS